MRIRTIKPEYWCHPILSKLPDETRLAAIGLLNIADDEGYLLADPKLIRSQLWPFDECSTRARRTLAQLAESGYIELRDHPTHGTIGLIVNFTKHQRVDRATPSKLKAYFLDDQSTINRRTLDDHSLLEQGKEQGTGNRERNGKKGGMGDVADEPQPAAKPKTMTDGEWLQSLTTDPAYQGVDVSREHAKMVRWCDTNGKQPSRKRFVNWLNRVERPMVGSGQRTLNQNGSKRILDTQPQIEIPEFK